MLDESKENVGKKSAEDSAAQRGSLTSSGGKVTALL
jgi:hypothetical protein